MRENAAGRSTSPAAAEDGEKCGLGPPLMVEEHAVIAKFWIPNTGWVIIETVRKLHR